MSPTATYPSEIKVKLTPEKGKLLQERASKQGMDIDHYLTKLIDRDLTSPTIDEILAPFRADVASSGMTQEELDQFFKGVRKEVSAAKRNP